jgi:FixJ family two-component response regulator
MVSQFLPGEYTVLVVDDDRKFCAELTSLLRRAGYGARAFHSAEAVLEAISEYPDHVCVISEIQLPGMTGLELISRLRQARVMTPVVVLTRLSDVATAVRAIRDSVSDYLLKPYVERDLINRVQKALLKQHEARH